MEENKLQDDFSGFLRSLCRYYMEFLETDFRKKRNPSRKVIFRQNDLLTSVPLFKYEKLKKLLVECVGENFKVNKLTNIVKDKFTIKLSEDLIERIIEDIEQLDFNKLEVKDIIQKVDSNFSTKFPDKEEFLKELEFEIKSLIEDNEGKVSKEQIKELLLDAVCYDFYDELYELWKNKTILEGQELYLYFYDIEFKDNRYPLFFMPITLNKRKSESRTEVSDIFDIEFGTQVLINKSALEFVSIAFNELINENRAQINIPRRHLYLGDFDIYAEMQKLLNEISAFFKLNLFNLGYAHPQRFKNEHVTISNNFYISICDKSDESLLNDYEELMELIDKGESSTLLEVLSKMSNDFLLENPKTFTLSIDDEYHEKELTEKLAYQSPIPLNEEQQKIISALRNPEIKNITIEGPPGTGKSHTITALIFYALLEHKTILMTSDKKEALDVVEDKISSVLDKIKKEDDFLQNPLLRLGKQETNYSQIFKQQNYEKISNRYNASRRVLEPLNKEINEATSRIAENVNNELNVYSGVDLTLIKDVVIQEKKIRAKFENTIDFPEALQDKTFPSFINQLYDSTKVFAEKRELFNAVKDNIGWGVLPTDYFPSRPREYLKDLKDTIQFFKMGGGDITVAFKNRDYLEKFLSVSEKLPDQDYFTFLAAYSSFEKIIDANARPLNEIFYDREDLKNNIAQYDGYMEAIKELSWNLSKVIKFYNETFKSKGKKAYLLGDISDANITELEKYLESVVALKSKFFGLIFKRKELALLNSKFSAQFPLSNLKNPHREIVGLEAELKLYKLLKTSQEISQKYSFINPDFVSWRNVDNFLKNYTSFDFDNFLKICQEAFHAFISAKNAFNAHPYVRELAIFYPFATVSHYRNLLSLNSYVSVYKEIARYIALLANLGSEIGFKSIVINHNFDLTVHHFHSKENIDKFDKTVTDLHEFVSFYESKVDLLKFINRFRKQFGKSIDKIGIDENNPSTFLSSKLSNFTPAEILELYNFLNKYYSIVDNYDQLKNTHYGNDRENLEDKLVLKMTHVLDKAVVQFRNENLNDQQQIKDLIRKKKRIPKELLRKLIEAFPCLIVNIRDLGEYLPLEPEIFDIVIIDEASQVSIAQAFPAILRGKKVVVLGDKKQYSNVKSHNASIATNNFLFSQVKEVYGKYIENYPKDKQQVLADVVNMFDVKKSILDFLIRMANYSCSLRKHFRGYPEIIGYSNKNFYNSFLQVMKIRSKAIESVLNFHLLDATDKTDVYANVNSDECDFIIRILESLKNRGCKQSVGIITPFTNQQRYIYGEILSHKDSDYFLEKMNLKVMTFDTCQGDEKDIIFYSFVERPGEEKLKYIFPRDLKMLEDEEDGSIKAQRLNVGFSRAREEMHFVLSKDVSEITGEIGRALTFYVNQLHDAKKIPSVAQCESPMEKFTLNLITQTNFYNTSKASLEIHPQFQIGRYLKQIHDIKTPNYRVDFLLVYKHTVNKASNIVIEYDGFEHHFTEQDNIGIENYDKFYVSQDVERRKILESYGYHFIRLNKFILRADPVQFLDKRLSEIVKETNSDPLIEQVISDAEEIAKGNIKQCSKCGLYKDINEFVDYARVTGYGRYCKSCKGKKVAEKRTNPLKNGWNVYKTETQTSPQEISEELIETIEVGHSDIKVYEKPVSNKDILEDAIKNKKSLKIKYRSRYNQTTTRTIKPVSINGDFVKAYCDLRKDNRTFRISHIKEFIV